MSSRDLIASFTRLLRRFSSEELEHALPLLVTTFLARDPRTEVPALVRGVVLDWMTARGLGLDASAEQLAAALAETYRLRPVDPELRRGLEELFGELVRDQAEVGQTRAEQLLGGRRARFEPRAAPEPGTVRASPLAAFRLQDRN